MKGGVIQMHLSKENLESFHKEEMDTQTMIRLLEHADSCDFCLQQLLEKEEDPANVPAPAYLKGEILSQAASPSLRIQKSVHGAPRKLQLFQLWLQTGAGIAIALFLLFFTAAGPIDFAPIHQDSGFYEEMEPLLDEDGQKDSLYRFSLGLGRGLFDGSQKITDYLNRISNTLLHGGK